MRRQFFEMYPWRGELAAWRPGFADRLPPGMRVPRLYRVAELGDDRLAVWMEDVRTLEGGWDLARFARVELACLPMLERDETWAHPLVAGAGDERLRGDLRVLAGRLGELLDRMDVLP